MRLTSRIKTIAKRILAGVLIAAILALAIHIYCCITTKNDMASFVTKNINLLNDLLVDVRGSFIDSSKLPAKYWQLILCGVTQINARSDSTYISFRWTHHRSEGTLKLVHIPSNACGFDKVIYEEIPADGVRIEGLGTSGEGFIDYDRLHENWFYVEAYVPT